MGIEPVPDQQSKINDVITFEAGKHAVVIYNGAPSGPITILISFSAAFHALAGTLAASIAAISLFT